MKNEDFLKEIGYLAIANRLKIITDRLFRGGGSVYRVIDIDFDPQWFSLFFFLFRKGTPQSIIVAAESLGISHPTVIQTAKSLIKARLIHSRQDRKDLRKRFLSLTAKGQKLALLMIPVWESFAATVAEIVHESDVDLLDMLERIETSMDREDVQPRILRHLKARQYKDVEIFPFTPALAREFHTQNKEWLTQDFILEKANHHSFYNPKKEILDKSNVIFFARLNGELVGTITLLKHARGIYHLPLIAVIPIAQGKQVGHKLVDTAINWCKAHKANTIELNLDSRLKAAVAFFKKIGFKAQNNPLQNDEMIDRSRSGFFMTLDIRNYDPRGQ
jgi:DNA-binding MarR family transcriptional regulator/GNAT superfamily N-acetyltransferase